MASLQKKGASWYCQFLYEGKRHTFTIGPVDQDEAEAKAGQVDLLLLRLSQRLAVIPPGMSIVEYLKFDCIRTHFRHMERVTASPRLTAFLSAITISSAQ